jgi:Mrp family chromosome partitioning ATPase
MYVVRSEKTKIISVAEGLRKLISVGTKVSGFIINDIDFSKNSFYARYYDGDYSSYY